MIIFIGIISLYDYIVLLQIERDFPFVNEHKVIYLELNSPK